MVNGVELNTQEFEANQAEQDKQQDGGQEGSELLAGKFKTTEDLEKSYLELQRKLGGNGAQEEQDPDTSEVDTGDDAGTVDSLKIGDQPEEDASEEDAAPALDIGKFTEELSETGELSEASEKSLRSVGITQEMQDAYIAGIKAQNELNTMKGQELVGGKQNYVNMIQWAAANLDQSEAQAFDEAVSISSNTFARESAIVALFKKFSDATGIEAVTLKGDGKNPGNSQGFRDYDEMTTAMTDPRYRTDQKYRAEVERKTAQMLKRS